MPPCGMNHSLSRVPPGFPGGSAMAAWCTVAPASRPVCGLFGNDLRNLWLTCLASLPGHACARSHRSWSAPDYRGDFGRENPAKVPTIFERREVRFLCGGAILRNPFHGVICPVGGVAGRYDRRQ